MLEPLKNLFTSNSFIPHGHCYLWKPQLVGLHIASDSLIALAYYSIPIMLTYFIHKRRDVPFQWIFLMFGAFIIACGTSHIMAVWTLWHPDYWLAGGIKLITAFISLCTAGELLTLIPKALALPSPAQLEATNQKLAQEISDRIWAEAALKQSEARFRLVFEKAAIGIVLADLTGRLFFLSTSYTGYGSIANELNSMARQASAERAWSSINRFFENCKKGIPGKKGFPQFQKDCQSCLYKSRML